MERYGPYICAMAALAGFRERNAGAAIVAFFVVMTFFTGLLSLLWLSGIVGREKRGKLPRLR